LDFHRRWFGGYTIDTDKIRSDFPALNDDSREQPIIYFDNASRTLTPKPVIDTVIDYIKSPCNAWSGHRFSVELMIKIKKAREKIWRFIHANNPNEIIWTRNTTEGINLISKSLDFKKGDIVITTDKEHNSNTIPWHNLTPDGIIHKVVKSNDDLTFNLNAFENMMSDKVKLISMAMTSLIDGYTIPAREIIKIAHDHDAVVLLDGALAVPHQKIDVRELDVDFLSFALENMCGVSGCGVLYGKHNLLEALKPFTSGGGTAAEVTYNKTEHHSAPAKFEAGNMNYAGIIGAGAAVDYLDSIGLENIQKHEHKLNKIITGQLQDFDAVSLIGPKDPKLRGGMFNFNIEGINPHDIAIHLEEESDILVRSGALCAHPWFIARKSNGAVSVMVYLYNTTEEVEALVGNLKVLLEDME
jgi:cysteine desulfurase/selenocysteine lyase